MQFLKVIGAAHIPKEQVLQALVIATAQIVHEVTSDPLEFIGDFTAAYQSVDKHGGLKRKHGEEKRS